MEEVRAEEDRRAGARAGGDRRLHAADARRIEAGERLVEQEGARLVEEAARDRQLLPHAARQLGRQRLALARELHLREQRPDPRLRVAHAVEPRHEAQVLLHREVVEQLRLVGHEGERALGGHRVHREVDAGHADAPGRRDDDPAMLRSVVVLPAPFGPTSPSTSPGGTRNDSECTAVKSP
jgi:hypothetical protein